MADVPEGGLIRGEDGVNRCFWCAGNDEYRAYHDDEWGRPVRDDRRLFEKLCLEGFQSGLSWLTILRKRENFRAAFAGFDFEQVARFGKRDVERLLADAGIIRHRGKIEATINNAQRALELVEEAGSIATWAWQFEPEMGDRPSPLTWEALAEMTTCPDAKTMAKELKRRGWKFVGPTTVYSFMEAMGMVNDHVDGCDTRASVESDRAAFERP